jgi:hypothetical protein
MLHKQRLHNYIVYPSWAKLSYRWKDLPRLLSDPMHSGYMPPGRDLQYFLDCGYPIAPQPFTMLDGPVGGGIIEWEGDPHAGRGWRWLPIIILRSEADLRPPNGMLGQKLDAQVVGIEPHGGGLERPKLHTCAATIEHIDAADDDVYWVLCSSSKGDRIKGLEALPEWAKSFGLAVERMSDVHPAVREQFDSWIREPEFGRRWYRIVGGGDELGFHFAVLVYFAYHLRWLAGKRIVSMHLVSCIEGKPNMLPSWNWESVRISVRRGRE